MFCEGSLGKIKFRAFPKRVVHEFYRFKALITWKLMEIHGIPRNFYGVSMEYPWSSIECHGVPWSIHGVPWNAMEFHGVP